MSLYRKRLNLSPGAALSLGSLTVQHSDISEASELPEILRRKGRLSLSQRIRSYHGSPQRSIRLIDSFSSRVGLRIMQFAAHVRWPVG